MCTIVIKAIIFISIALVTGCDRNDIFDKPVEGSPKLPPKPLETSYITLSTSIPFTMIQKTIDASVPSEQSFEGTGDEPCAEIPTIKKGSGFFDIPYLTSDRLCAGNTWSATARKTGPVSVSKSGDAMRVAVPIDINGKAGVRGDLAKLLSLSGKNFNASVKPIVDIKVGIGSDWCPHIIATPTQDWVSNAAVEIVGKNCLGFDLGPFGNHRACAGPAYLDLTNQARKAVNEQQDAIKNAAANAINCNEIRQSIQSQWKPIVIPLGESGKSPLFLNIIPESFGFSNIKATERAMLFAVKVGVKAQLDANSMSAKPVQLPPLEPVTADNSNLHIVLRANVDYAKIADTLKASVINKTFMSTTPAGDVSVKAEDVEVFPSNGKIAIGIKIAAKLPGQYFNTNGWVYMTTIPTVTESGTAIELRKLSYSTILDNKLWKVLVAIFDKQIIREIKKKSKIDLQSTITKSSEDLATKINSTSFPGLIIKAEKPIAKLIDVAIDSTTLVATATADMNFSVAVTDEVVQ